MEVVELFRWQILRRRRVRDGLISTDIEKMKTDFFYFKEGAI